MKHEDYIRRVIKKSLIFIIMAITSLVLTGVINSRFNKIETEYLAEVKKLNAEIDELELFIETESIKYHELKENFDSYKTCIDKYCVDKNSHMYDEVKIIDSYIKIKNPTISKETRRRIAVLIVKNTIEADFDKNLMVGLIQVETVFNPTQTSEKGAKGLTQIMYKWWGKYLKDRGIIKTSYDLYEPETSIKGCIEILEYLNRKYGNIIEALKRYGGDNDYSFKVMVAMDMFDKFENSERETVD